MPTNRHLNPRFPAQHSTLSLAVTYPSANKRPAGQLQRQRAATAGVWYDHPRGAEC
jgi:hypothetical protein